MSILPYKDRKFKINLAVFIVFALILFIFMVRNLSFPLLWNDEAETAVYAQSILKFGYPKVHDGKNVLNVSELPDKNIGVKKGKDAWIYISSWGQYYFAVPGVYIANHVSDLHLKTLIIRIPFVLSAWLALIIFAYINLKVLKSDRLLFIILFFGIEAFSIPFLLQMRQMRHYSLDLLLVVGFFLVQYIFMFNKNIYSLLHQGLNLLILIVALNLFTPLFFVFFGMILIESIFRIYISKSIKRNAIKDLVLRNLCLWVSIPLAIGYLNWFEFFKISFQVSMHFNYSFSRAMQNFTLILDFFVKHNFLAVVVLLRLISIYGNLKVKNSEVQFWSHYLSIFIVLYTLVILRIPYVFERYVILLQPFMIAVFISDFLFIKNVFIKNSKNLLFVYYYLLFIVVSAHLAFNFNLIKGYLTELVNPYYGPVDHAVMFLKNKYPNSQNLTIATNYEEYVYMYYLGSKVIVGYVGNNLDEDSREKPDVIVIRNGRPNNLKLLNDMLRSGKYTKNTLQIYDYLYNNIPEVTLPTPHLFATKFALNENDKLVIYTKDENK